MVVWILSLLTTVGLWVGAVVVLNKGDDGDLATMASNAPMAGFMAGGGVLAGTVFVGAFLLWLAVSAIVREHHRDRDAMRRGL
jgi:hypothetical protein